MLKLQRPYIFCLKKIVFGNVSDLLFFSKMTHVWRHQEKNLWNKSPNYFFLKLKYGAPFDNFLTKMYRGYQENILEPRSNFFPRY